MPKVFVAEHAARLMPIPAQDANKYSRGMVLVVAGSAKFPGAAIMTAQAGPRAGAGYGKLLTPASAAAAARCHLVSVPVEEVPEKSGTFCVAAVEAAVAAAEKARAIVVGPGLDRTESAQEFVLAFLRTQEIQQKPLVIDADALFVIAQDKDAFDVARPGGCKQVLTPHEGEAARLLGRKVGDRQEAATQLAAQWHSTVVLKGPKTIVASPAGDVTVIENAGPELSKAGSGDVLAGIIGALLAQGLDDVDAACLGVYLHGKAGALAAEEKCVVSVMPEDLIEYIGPAIRCLEGLLPELSAAQADASRRAFL